MAKCKLKAANVDDVSYLSRLAFTQLIITLYIFHLFGMQPSFQPTLTSPDLKRFVEVGDPSQTIDDSLRSISRSRSPVNHVNQAQSETVGQYLYHLESRWRNSNVWVYNGPLLSHLLGVAPSTFTMVYQDLPSWMTWCFFCKFLKLLRPSNKMQRHIGSLKFFWKIWSPAVEFFKLFLSPYIHSGKLT